MAIESQRHEDDLDPNYVATRVGSRRMALSALSLAKVHLDNVMRGTKDVNARTLVSTTYNIVREATDLVELLGELDKDRAERE